MKKIVKVVNYCSGRRSENFVTTTSTPSSFPLSQVCVDDEMDEMFVRLDDDMGGFRGSFISYLDVFYNIWILHVLGIASLCKFVTK
jgi:hypothetical protein